MNKNNDKKSMHLIRSLTPNNIKNKIKDKLNVKKL